MRWLVFFYMNLPNSECRTKYWRFLPYHGTVFLIFLDRFLLYNYSSDYTASEISNGPFYFIYFRRFYWEARELHKNNFHETYYAWCRGRDVRPVCYAKKKLTHSHIDNLTAFFIGYWRWNKYVKYILFK